MTTLFIDPVSSISLNNAECPLIQYVRSHSHPVRSGQIGLLSYSFHHYVTKNRLRCGLKKYQVSKGPSLLNYGVVTSGWRALAVLIKFGHPGAWWCMTVHSNIRLSACLNSCLRLHLPCVKMYLIVCVPLKQSQHARSRLTFISLLW